jgi:hypothetical protein
MAKTIMRWVIEKDITTLLALMTEDHPDHTAAALAGRLAITELVHRNHLPRHTRQLELLAATQDPSSSVQEYTSIIPVHHSTNSLIRAYGAAVCNPSQFEVYALDASAHSPLYSHQIIRGGYVFELSSYQRLHQYPIDRDAHYGVWQSDAVLPVQRLSLANHEYAILD